jgi:anti-anti-sigma factor
VKFLATQLAGTELVAEVGRQLYRLADQGDPPRLVLDFSGVNLFSSTMLAKVIGLNRRIRPAGGRLVLCGLDPDLHGVLRVIEGGRHTKLVDLYPDRQEALRSFSG